MLISIEIDSPSISYQISNYDNGIQALKSHRKGLSDLESKKFKKTYMLEIATRKIYAEFLIELKFLESAKYQMEKVIKGAQKFELPSIQNYQGLLTKINRLITERAAVG